METGPGKKLFRGSGIEWREGFPTLKRKHRPPISGPYAAQDRPFPIPWSPRLVPVRAVEKHIMMRTNGPRGTPSTGEARDGKRIPTGEGIAERCDEFMGEGFEGLLPQRSAGRWLRIHTCAKRRADPVILDGKIFW